MSGRNSLVLLFFVVLFSGCSIKNHTTPKIEVVNVDVNNSKNFLMLEALYNQYNDKNLSKSMENYLKLYYLTDSNIYLKYAINLSFALEDDNSVDTLLEEGLKRFPSDYEILKIYANRLIQQKHYKKAQKILKKILVHKKSDDVYELYATTFYFQKKYTKALKYFKKAYALNTDETTLFKIVALLDENLHERKKAISYLQNYIRFYSVSLNAYIKLLHLYGKDTNVDGLISTYKSMYTEFKNEKYAKKTVELYMYKNNTKGAIKFLEKTGYNQDMLMDLYMQNREFKKAYILSSKLYKQSGNTEYLGRMAIYEYESNQKNLTPKILKSVSKKFDEVVEKMQLPLFLNYYGYLLIDHELDVGKGIKYVKMALEREPESVYYIDSLAWGYYKQNRCEDALREIEKIVNKTNEDDVIKHFNIIKKCAKGKN